MKGKNFIGLSKCLFILFTLLFVIGIAVGMLGREICTRDNGDYQALQPELFAPDEIDTVLHEADLYQLYVCYNDASYVNVYSEDGAFRWAISTPYLRNTYFELSDGRLIVYNLEDAYVYDSANGAFIEKRSSEELELNYSWETEYTDEFEGGAFYFDTYQVYRAQEDGSLTTLVARPWWYWLFNFGVCWSVSFCAAFGIGVLIFLEKRKDWKVLQQEKGTSNPSDIIENRKACIIIQYFRITSIVHIVYAILDILSGIFLDGILCIGIIPIAIHMIVSSIILYNMLDCVQLTENEQRAKDYWATREIGSFIIAFLSVIVAGMLA